MQRFKIYKRDKTWIVETRNGSKCEIFERTSKAKTFNMVQYLTPGSDMVYEITARPKEE